ncbi:uncharacterized protein AMSG_06483 [Thecamonas trahens ATCC 50062]|uniref:Uncharacterized protein n=1 Tax=Thecamonas trahens ATCC 50062 TaxID=461836 RepID=A0A0L0DFP0_THETB|nr:hypothetical protein AMSG_06483 [Thecamonas trahens ATCC 50062]KNC51132.1 hypothetical protein AMSG_06483 [Thecamonas trahens ATCC 50062]|eukprot:XP_013756338.1 hypothetical protein AMSG_06483 [Thecamonas trahens ATCC 50062]
MSASMPAPESSDMVPPEARATGVKLSFDGRVAQKWLPNLTFEALHDLARNRFAKLRDAKYVLTTHNKSGEIRLLESQLDLDHLNYVVGNGVINIAVLSPPPNPLPPELEKHRKEAAEAEMASAARIKELEAKLEAVLDAEQAAEACREHVKSLQARIVQLTTELESSAAAEAVQTTAAELAAKADQLNRDRIAFEQRRKAELSAIDRARNTVPDNRQLAARIASLEEDEARIGARWLEIEAAEKTRLAAAEAMADEIRKRAEADARTIRAQAKRDTALQCIEYEGSQAARRAEITSLEQVVAAQRAALEAQRAELAHLRAQLADTDSDDDLLESVCSSDASSITDSGWSLSRSGLGIESETDDGGCEWSMISEDVAVSDLDASDLPHMLNVPNESDGWSTLLLAGGMDANVDANDAAAADDE